MIGTHLRFVQAKIASLISATLSHPADCSIRLGCIKYGLDLSGLLKSVLSVALLLVLVDNAVHDLLRLLNDIRFQRSTSKF